MLKYSREDSADILKDFECGIRAMDDFMMHSGTMYPTLEIDYLAVRSDLRDKGIGTEIIAHLSETAHVKKCYFLTVDAYHTKGYTAIPFYEKQGFFALQEYSEEYDTLRMAKRV